MIFAHDFVTRESHWQITSLVTKISLFTVTHASFYNDFSSGVMYFANDFHEWRSYGWKSLANHFTIDEKSLFTVMNVLFYFLRAISSPEHNSAINHQSRSSPLSIRTVFSEVAFWRHHGWSVTSRESEVLALWRHIPRLFLHAQIGTTAIFTSE